jgi:ADP-ribose pyrophosphatase
MPGAEGQRIYRHCTQCGAASLKALSRQEYHCSECGFRHYINPIAAVAAILTNARNEILVIRRAIEPGRGQLGLPGGFVDPGETAEAAVRRE